VKDNARGLCPTSGIGGAVETRAFPGVLVTAMQWLVQAGRSVCGCLFETSWL